MTRITRVAAVVAVLAALAGTAGAQQDVVEAVAAEPTLAEIALMLQQHQAEQTILLNTLWVMIAAFLVFFMQAGFAYVEAGFTRAKNANNIMMKNLMDFSIGSVAFLAVGFAIMFGDSVGGFIGVGDFFLLQTGGELYNDSMPVYAFFLFQMVFAATAATIVSGAMAERTKYSSYMVYSAVMTALFYPIVGHWTWGGGWLAGLGFADFAGSTIVHSVGGWFALAGAIVVGARIGKYTPDGKPKAIPGHSMPMASLGVFILWLGWFGFNAGSTLGATTDIAMIALNTSLAAAAGSIGALAISYVYFREYDLSMTLNGALAGLVSITAAPDVTTPITAIIIGVLGGLIVVNAVIMIDRWGVDDPVGAISVHGVCGAFGTLALGIFSTKSGVLYGHGFQQLRVQLVGVLSIMAFSLVAGFVTFSLIKAAMGLRVSPEEEEEGLDMSEHGIGAYPDPGFHTDAA
jgi:Amt family ammonium transporter